MTVDTLPLPTQDALITRCHECGMQIIPLTTDTDAICPNSFCGVAMALRNHQPTK